MTQRVIEVPIKNFASNISSRSHWSARDLVVIGVFSAAAKLSTLLIALIGGGMNPISLLLKNLVLTTLMIVMLYKVRKTGTLMLFTVVNCLISLLVMGGNVTLIPPAFCAAAVAEVLMYLCGGIKKSWVIYLGVAAFDLLTKGFSLGVSFLYMRETPGLMIMVVPIVLIGYAGSLMGLFSGYKTVKELRHAGIVNS